MPEQALCKGMEKAVRREKQQPWSGTVEALLTWELVETVESSLRGSQSMCLQRPLPSEIFMAQFSQGDHHIEN